MCHVYKEQLEIEIFSKSRVVIKFWKGHQDVIVHGTVEQAHSDDWEDGPERVPEKQVGILEHAEWKCGQR